MATEDDFWAGAEIIHTYTRAQAIADGALVDVTTTAKEAGFVFPVAMTAAAWADTVAWDERYAALQDESGRLWDVLTMARHAIIASVQGANVLPFQVLRIPADTSSVSASLADLVVHMGPGDAAEPVLTIMLPGED